MKRREDEGYLTTKTKILLERLQDGNAPTKRELSQLIYGDDRHTPHVDGLIRTLKKHGYAIGLVPKNPTAFPPEAFYVRLLNEGRTEEAKIVNEGGYKYLRTRLKSHFDIIDKICSAFPQLLPEIDDQVSDIFLRVIDARRGLNGHLHKLLLNHPNTTPHDERFNQPRITTPRLANK